MTAVPVLVSSAALRRAGQLLARAAPPPGPADPTAVKEEVRRVMSQRRFSYEPSLLERLGKWLSDLFNTTEPSGGGGTFGGGLGPWFAWLLIGLAVVLAVVVTVLVVRSRRTAVPDEDLGPSTETEIEHRRRAGEWSADAERWEREGRWKEAVRARYRALVRTLVDRRQVPDVPGRTTGELRGDLALTTPDAAAAFDTACLVFELAWYADLPTGPEQVAVLRDAAAVVLGAAVVDRFGATTTPGTTTGGPPPGVPVGSGAPR